MSEFYLSLRNRVQFCITKGTAETVPKTDQVLARRDPLVPVEWKPGVFYYNPLYDRRQAFIYRGDQKLISVNGHSPGAKGLKPPYDRTWFELLPTPLELNQLPAQLESMIKAIPSRRGAIAPVIMQQLSVRIPADFNPTTADEWYRWLGTVQTPINGTIMHALESTNNYPVLISQETEREFLSGQIMPPGITLKIKLFRFIEVTKRVRQLSESAYITVRPPKEVIEEGSEALKAWLEENPEILAKFQLPSVEEGETLIEKVLETKVIKEGPVEVAAWHLDSIQRNWTNLWGAKLRTENDLIREILAENDPGA